MKFGYCKPGRVGKAIGVKMMKNNMPDKIGILKELAKPDDLQV